MRLSESVLRTVFHTEGLTRSAQFEALSGLGRETVCSPIDCATISDIPAFEALVLGYDTKNYAGQVFSKCQELSLSILCGEMGYGLSDRRLEGQTSELAVHGLAWYGIARQGIGRYARMASAREDESTPGGRKNGYDLIFRTDNRRHRVQVKSRLDKTDQSAAYENNIIVVSPQILLGQGAVSLDLHTALAADDCTTLASAFHRFETELRTQKAPNGRRKVI